MWVFITKSKVTTMHCGVGVRMVGRYSSLKRRVVGCGMWTTVGVFVDRKRFTTWSTKKVSIDFTS